MEIVQLAGESIGSELNKALAKGLLEHMLVSSCGGTEFQDISPNNQERLLATSSEMIDIDQDGQKYRMMKYEVSQALWESVTGYNPSHFRGASLPVECVSWMDCVILPTS